MIASSDKQDNSKSISLLLESFFSREESAWRKICFTTKLFKLDTSDKTPSGMTSIYPI